MHISVLRSKQRYVIQNYLTIIETDIIAQPLVQPHYVMEYLDELNILTRLLDFYVPDATGMFQDDNGMIDEVRM